jgi:hypothetical protein
VFSYAIVLAAATCLKSDPDSTSVRNILRAILVLLHLIHDEE